MAQRGADKQDHWQEHMTVLVINRKIVKSISILTVVIPQIMNFDVDNKQDCFCQEVKWMLAIH